MDNRTDEKMIEAKKKPPRFRNWLHLWGGGCLYIFAKASGVFEAILAPLEGFASPDICALSAGLLAVGIVVAGYFLSSSLVRVIDFIAPSQKGKTIIKGALVVTYFVGAILLVILVGPALTKSGQISQPSAVQTIGQAIAPVITMSTIQDSEGFTEADFNLEFLKKYEEWSVETTLQKSRAAYAEAGNDPTQFKPVPVSDSLFVNVGGKKLGIIKITIYPSQTDRQRAVKGVDVVGFTQRGFEIVGCIRGSNHDIPIWRGECGKKIKEVFGVGIQP